MANLDKLFERRSKELTGKIAQGCGLPEQHPNGGVFIIGDIAESTPYPLAQRTAEQAKAFSDITAVVVAKFCEDPQAYLDEVAPATDPSLDIASFLTPQLS